MTPVDADPSVEVRPYAPADREACRSLWIELTEWHREIYGAPDIGGDQPGLLFDAHLDRVGEDNVWVAEVAGKVVGLTGLIPDEEEPELEPLVVAESHRGRGIAGGLVEVVVRAARERGAQFLRARPTARNHRALRVFHGLGFDLLGHLELLLDFRPADRQRWEPGPRLADRTFRE